MFPDEILWLTYCANGKPLYYITSNATRTEYYLYKDAKGKPKKTSRKAATPDALYKFIKD